MTNRQPLSPPAQEIIAIGKARHGDNWKAGLSVDTGWSWWTFNRIERGEYVNPKILNAVKNLKATRES